MASCCRLSLPPADRCSDEYGGPVDEECYMKRLALRGGKATESN